MELLTSGAVIVALAVLLISASVRIVPEYQRGVIFRLGRIIGAKGPGLFFLIPIVDRMIKVDLRTVTMDVPPQEAITMDNVPIRVNAVVYFRVVDPNNSVIEVENFILATSQIAQTTLRSVLGQSDLDHLLTAREQINSRLQGIIDEQTDPWGIKVSVVEIKDVEIPQGMQRAMARQAEAERERRAKVIAAEGEFQASEKLAQAAVVLDRTPTAIQLRYLQTLIEIASEKNSTTIFPIPIDLVTPFLKKLGNDLQSPPAPAPEPTPAKSPPAAPEQVSAPEPTEDEG
ncbi:MAG TPA: slipin family protein [Thermoleophilia bacterium]|nr:slipin family protein [Thermoleophilia bacterium]